MRVATAHWPNRQAGPRYGRDVGGPRRKSPVERYRRLAQVLLWATFVATFLKTKPSMRNPEAYGFVKVLAYLFATAAAAGAGCGAASMLAAERANSCVRRVPILCAGIPSISSLFWESRAWPWPRIVWPS
jgi:hypothetical protein